MTKFKKGDPVTYKIQLDTVRLVDAIVCCIHRDRTITVEAQRVHGFNAYLGYKYRVVDTLLSPAS